MFKKVIGKTILFAALTLCLTNIANATVPGPYVGGQFGYGNTDYAWQDGWNFNSTSTDSSGPAGRIFGGYQFNRYFTIELGYLQFSAAHVKYYNIFTGQQSYSGSVNENAIDLMAKGILPITDKFNAYAKLGAAYVTAKTTYVPYDSFMIGETYHEVLPAGAIGISYDITPNVPVDLSYMHIQHGGDIDYSAEFFSLGIAYHFNM